MQLAVAAVVGAALLSLGPVLALGGHPTSIPLPFVIFNHLPFFDNILPVRFSLEMFAGLAAVLAFGLDDLRRNARVTEDPDGGSSRRRAAAIVVITTVVLVVTWLPRWPYPTQPNLSLPAAVRAVIPSGQPIAVTYPYASRVAPDAMLWQANDDFVFRLLGGYAAHPGANGRLTTQPVITTQDQLSTDLFTQGVLAEFGRPVQLTNSPKEREVVRRSLAATNARLVIVDRSYVGSSLVIHLFTQVLGSPTAESDNFLVWVLHRDAA